MSNQLDFKHLSIDELEELIVSASQEIEARRQIEAEQIRKKIEKLLDNSGLSLNEVFKEKNSRKGRKVPMKYANPDNPEQQWSGRGKMPVWMREKVEAGADRESFLIDKENE